MSTIENTATVFNIVYESTVGIDVPFMYFSSDVFIDPIPTGAVYDLTGWTAEGKLLDKEGGTELLALSGNQASPGGADYLKFIVADYSATNPETDEVKTIPSAQGVRLVVEPFPSIATSGWFYINLIDSSGNKRPFVKGPYSPNTCSC